MLTLLLLFLPRCWGWLAVRRRGEQASFGGSVRLWGSAALELLLSALQAPLRMLAHSIFVLAALTGLRLDWKSPSRDAAAVAWRDAARASARWHCRRWRCCCWCRAPLAPRIWRRCSAAAAGGAVHGVERPPVARPARCSAHGCCR